jgi:hypothetical protein
MAVLAAISSTALCWHSSLLGRSSNDGMSSLSLIACSRSQKHFAAQQQQQQPAAGMLELQEQLLA